MDIEKYGFCAWELRGQHTGTPARILSVHHNYFHIACNYGMGIARLKAGEYRPERQAAPVTGDFVLIDWQPNGESRIIKTLPRKTFLSRSSPSSSGCKEQAIAANFDTVFILQSLDRDFNLRRLERYVTLAWQSGATPVVILTKTDRVQDYTPQLLAAHDAAVGVDIIPISAKTGFGLDRLQQYFSPGKTVVFLGSSGVGKSTLINTLAGEDIMETNGIREKDGHGKHTTTRRQLILLKSGAMVIDTPGMRELGMWEAQEGIQNSFQDVEQFLGKCRFRNCRHQGEPGCAVAEAIRQGHLSHARWESYRKLCMESEWSEKKAEYLREKQKRFKEIAKFQKARAKQPDYRIDPCTDSFYCKVCGAFVTPENAGSRHRNHCPQCLSSIHLDNQPGDRASLCRGQMDAIAIWVRKNGEWAIIHRCRSCGVLHANRIAADDNASLLTALAMRPLELTFRQAHSVKASAKRALPPVCAKCGAQIVLNKDVSQRLHCPQCLTGVHDECRATVGKGELEPVSIWIRENGIWAIIYRCRSCGLLLSHPVATGDNTALLASIAMRPIATPPFPLWH